MLYHFSEPVGTFAESDPTVPTMISPQQKEQLRRKQYFESEQIIYKFQKLFTSTKKSLREEKVSVAELISHLECLGSIKPTYVDIGRSPLRSQLPGLADAKTVDAVMSVVKDYCSFFNYHMVEHIIDEFGTKQDKENMASYKEDFTKYAECCITQCPSEVGKMSEEGCVWHSNTDKIGKLKYMIKLESDIWSNSNMWSKLLPMYGQSQIYSQILYDQTQIHGQTKVMVIFPIYGQTCSKYIRRVGRGASMLPGSPPSPLLTPRQTISMVQVRAR